MLDHHRLAADFVSSLPVVEVARPCPHSGIEREASLVPLDRPQAVELEYLLRAVAAPPAAFFVTFRGEAVTDEGPTETYRPVGFCHWEMEGEADLWLRFPSWGRVAAEILCPGEEACDECH